MCYNILASGLERAHVLFDPLYQHCESLNPLKEKNSIVPNFSKLSREQEHHALSIKNKRKKKQQGQLKEECEVWPLHMPLYCTCKICNVCPLFLLLWKPLKLSHKSWPQMFCDIYFLVIFFFSSVSNWLMFFVLHSCGLFTLSSRRKKNRLGEVFQWRWCKCCRSQKLLSSIMRLWVSWFLVLYMGDLNPFIAHFIAYFLSFCHSVCGLSPFIVWSPSDQITKLCKWHIGSDKRVGYYFDYAVEQY